MRAAMIRAVLSLALAVLVPATSAFAAGSSYAGGVGGASVGLSTLRIYFAAPISWDGNTFDVTKTPIAMVCTVLPHTYTKKYIFVVAKAPKQIHQTVPHLDVLTSFFAGVFKGAKDVITKFPHPITCVVRSPKITPADLLFASQGRQWERDRNVRIHGHVATIIITTSDFFELGVVVLPKPGRLVKVCVITFAANSSTIQPGSPAASAVGRCAIAIANSHYKQVIIVGDTNLTKSRKADAALARARAAATERALKAAQLAIHAMAVTISTQTRIARNPTPVSSAWISTVYGVKPHRASTKPKHKTTTTTTPSSTKKKAT